MIGQKFGNALKPNQTSCSSFMTECDLCGVTELCRILYALLFLLFSEGFYLGSKFIVKKKFILLRKLSGQIIYNVLVQ